MFHHVTVRGRIDGQLILNSNIESSDENPAQAAFDAANAAYYRDVDWALDISEASFSVSPDIDTIPGRLIRRDPETQVLVTLERLSGASLDGLDLGVSGFELGLQKMRRYGLDGIVFVAPKRNPKFSEYMEALAVIRKNGWAEED